MDEQEILEHAHASIQNKDYRNARRLLLKIPSNPTAAKWLTKINQIAPPETRPTSTFTTSKPLPGVDPRTDDVRKRSDTGKKVSFPIFVAAVFVICAVITALFGRVMDVINEVFVPAGSYQDRHISLAHPSGWTQLDTSLHGWCFSSGVECLYFLAATPDIGLLVMLVPLPDDVSVSQYAEAQWQARTNDPRLIESGLYVQEMDIADMPAVAYMYYQSNPADTNQDLYMIDIHVVDGNDGYVINVSSATSCNLVQKRDTVNEVLSTLRIASRTARVMEDGYTAFSPVTLQLPNCN